MKFAKFTILNPKANQTSGAEEQDVLFNLDHIVSLKPIRMSTSEGLMNGFWIRTTNGKKYKAVKIPAELLSEIGEEYASPIVIMDTDETAFQ